jgi:hypothetical protein
MTVLDRPLRCWLLVLATLLTVTAAPRPAAAYITPSGYIQLDPNPAPRFQLNAGLGGYYPGLGSAFVNFDIFATSKLSFPIGLQGLFAAGGGGFTLDAGIRYRAASILSIGGGIGGAYVGVRDYYDTGDFRVWLELALGRRFGRVGLSFSLRPTFGTLWEVVILPFELDLAIYVSARWAVVISGVGGPIIGYGGGAGGYGGGYLGVSGSL